MLDLHHLVELVDGVVGGDAAAVDHAGHVADRVVGIARADARRRRDSCRELRMGAAASSRPFRCRYPPVSAIADRVVDDAVAVGVALGVVRVARDVRLGIDHARQLAEVVVGVEW